ncbi:MAG: hypothetical protein WBE34_11625, partial [Candidatus Nitrosopolaris sp.]
QRVTGLETWFYLPNLKTIGAPPKWKMAIVSFIAAYSISLVAHSLLSIYLGQRPLLPEILMTILLVVGLTYFAMPLLRDCFDAGCTREIYDTALYNDHLSSNDCIDILNRCALITTR